MSIWQFMKTSFKTRLSYKRPNVFHCVKSNMAGNASLNIGVLHSHDGTREILYTCTREEISSRNIFESTVEKWYSVKYKRSLFDQKINMSSKCHAWVWNTKERYHDKQKVQSTVYCGCASLSHAYAAIREIHWSMIIKYKIRKSINLSFFDNCYVIETVLRNSSLLCLPWQELSFMTCNFISLLHPSSTFAMR